MSKYVPNSFQVANAFVDEAMSKISDASVKIYLIINRKTRGWAKECDALSITQLEKLSGKSHPTVVRCTKELVKVGLVKKHEQSIYGNVYSLKDNYFVGEHINFASKSSVLIQSFSLFNGQLVKYFNYQKPSSKKQLKGKTSKKLCLNFPQKSRVLVKNFNHLDNACQLKNLTTASKNFLPLLVKIFNTQNTLSKPTNQNKKNTWFVLENLELEISSIDHSIDTNEIFKAAWFDRELSSFKNFNEERNHSDRDMVIDTLDPTYTSTYAKYAKVGIVEDMTGIDAMSGVQAPYDSASSDKNWVGTGSGTSGVNGWARWYYAASGSVSGGLINSQTPAAGNRQWILIGNGDYFYILPTTTVPSATVNTQHASAYGFGAFKSLLNADNSCTFLQSHLTLNNNNASINVNLGLVSSSASSSLLLLRDYAQSANYKTANCLSLSSDTAGSGVNNVIGASTLTNTAPFAPVFIKEDTTNVLRGQIKNLFWLFQQKPYSNFQLIEKDGALYIAAFIASTSNLGQIVFKIGDL